VAKRAGLPVTIRMRHDEHYVDSLTGPAVTPIGRMVSIDLVDPNPDQPRQSMGDLSELMASIAEKGILEPLLVRAVGSRFQIIAGERRYQAAVQVGLPELPVVVRDVDEAETIELALIENIQRKDLTPFEEAEALYSLAERNDYTHEDLAKRLGKSRTAITESLALHKMPSEVKNLCRLADISAKSLLLEIVRQSDPEKMIAMVERLTRDGAVATRQRAREESAPKKPLRGRPKAFVFSYKPPTKAFNMRLQFSRGQVERAEIITALEAIIQDLRSQHN
jgi:ParB family transcriptional regulator, chromosome partitioning protein